MNGETCRRKKASWGHPNSKSGVAEGRETSRFSVSGIGDQSEEKSGEDSSRREREKERDTAIPSDAEREREREREREAKTPSSFLPPSFSSDPSSPPSLSTGYMDRILTSAASTAALERERERERER